MKIKKPVLLLTVFIVFTAHSCLQTSKVPDELIGVWKTTDSEYTGTFLELTADKIIIGKKGGDVDAYAIKKIKREKVKGSEELYFVITYKDLDEKEYKFPIYFNPADGGMIRWANRPKIIWTKGIK